uniref:Uncharacterized protein n=1 Tax=Rhizophora mucronata TaxID=61149 RepID=A0A2P2PWC4_RHIMU
MSLIYVLLFFLCFKKTSDLFPHCTTFRRS